MPRICPSCKEMLSNDSFRTKKSRPIRAEGAPCNRCVPDPELDEARRADRSNEARAQRGFDALREITNAVRPVRA